MNEHHGFLQIALWIVLIVMAFNVIIFVHELGHFLAAKWRGLQVDRFQIWFGKPIWKKTIKGVQYGFGWIPAGGFVALPQMAPMESIEGESEKPREPLPPIKPLDKIIVAFAGPLFSLLLALLSAVVVWQVGKPKDFIPSQVIGYVEHDSPAEKAGLKAGDKILEINGSPVNGYAGSFDSIMERVVLSRGKEIVFKVERAGEPGPLELRSGVEISKTKWFERSGLRHVGIDSAGPVMVGAVSENSPAEKAGLKKGEQILAIDGEKLFGITQFLLYLKDHEGKSVNLLMKSTSGEEREVVVTPVRPLSPKDAKPMIGVQWDDSKEKDERIVYPKPLVQVADSLEMMWVTITSVIAPDSGIGVSHLSGPVGIARLQFLMLQTENGWRRILAFMVIFNINLAVLNMLPFPVLDGGHITLAIIEWIRGRQVGTKLLTAIQSVFAVLLISLMLFVTSKDLGDVFGGLFGKGGREKVVFPKE